MVDRVLMSNWSESRTKRVFDFACALPLTVLFLPLMAVLALLVKISSDGPILFRQSRGGKDCRAFELLKFRSMSHSPADVGPGLTRAGDSRVTRLGSVLRSWKLDELPQLFNVLRGDMSLVGPRPDLPEYVGELTGRAREILRLRPGITGWATLHFRTEEELLATVPPDQQQSFYTRVLLPKKASLDLEYGMRATLVTDIYVLLRTCRIVLQPRAQQNRLFSICEEGQQLLHR